MKKHTFSYIIINLICLNLVAQDTEPEIKLFMPVHLFQEMHTNSNTAYSPSFRAAWTILINEITGSPVELRTGTPLAEELNHHTYITDNETGWINGAGFIENGILDEINRKMMDRYNIEAPGLDDIKDEKEGILCYSYLNFETVFKEAFEEFNWSFNSDDGAVDVKYFGVSKGQGKEKKMIRKQVSIFDYKNPDDFILKITPSDPDFEILISEMPPEENIFETLKEVDRRLSESIPDPLSSEDELMIPMVSLDENNIYDELLNKYLLNKGFEDYFIASATQGIKFSLDQAGAKGEISGKVFLKKGPVPRIYAIDRPFMVIIRRKGSEEPLIFLRIINTSYLRLSEKN